MSSPFTFAVPSSGQHLLPTRALSRRKRKRHDQRGQSPHDDDQNFDSSPTELPEYTAVVTPAERSQRRLAGLAVDQEPPPFPFPHQSTRQDDGWRAHTRDAEIPSPISPAKASLHSQHLAAMTALLHRCIMERDYVRAGRALGLILRNKIGGSAIDLRSEGLWGIGAEILLMQGHVPENSKARSRITREGFERARVYYERLMVQYPTHKTWPDAVNTLDFCIAMFSLWVYVTNQESVYLQGSVHPDGRFMGEDNNDIGLLEAKQWELGQAMQISAAMDMRMRDSPFNGDPELTKLRAMVALWTADCFDACADLERDNEHTEDEALYQDRVETVLVDGRINRPTSSNAIESTVNRTLAEALLAKLRKTR